jgi:hypothetical protein
VNFRDGNEATAYYTDNLAKTPSKPRSRSAVSEGCELDRLAAKNKCLAKSNNSDAGGEATKKRNRQ